MERGTNPQRCLVTGANRGLGLVLVGQLLAREDRVVATCRQPGKATALNTLAGEYPGHLHVTPLDMAEPRSHAALVHKLPLLADGETLDLLSTMPACRTTAKASAACRPAIWTPASARMPPGLPADAGAVATAGGWYACRQHLLGDRLDRTETGLPGQGGAEHGELPARPGAGRVRHRGVALHPGWVRTDMGGESATLSAQESAAGLLRVIAGLQAQDSGAFLDWQDLALPR